MERAMFDEKTEDISKLKRLVEQKTRGLLETRNAMDTLRENGIKLIQAPVDGICHTCGQELPSGMIEMAQEAKASEIEEINKQGLALKDMAANIEKEIEATKATLAELEALTYMPDEKVVAERDRIAKELETLKAGDNTAAVDGKKKIIEQTKETIKVHEAELNKVKQCSEMEAEIDRLMEEQSRLAKEYEKLERSAYLMDQFTKFKVAMLEEKINSHFSLARFKLIKENIGGSVEDCCEVIYKGVPFNSGLNHGAQINVGIDIINTLSKYYGKEMPIFVDNAEAVTKLQETDTQIIRLIVKEGEKLRMAA